MKTIITILFLTINTTLFAQDWFIGKGGDSTKCTITLVNDNNLFYTINKKSKYESLNNVQTYSINGIINVVKLSQNNDTLVLNTGEIIIGKINDKTRSLTKVTKIDGTQLIIGNDVIKETAGKNLIFAAKIVFRSVGIIVVGTLITVVGVIALPEASIACAIVGGGLIIGGGIYSITAWGKIEKAGLILDKIKL